ncbi:MAG TPA: hypothetical protein PLM61_15445 [Thermoanaerobaculales bacterium]|jgi:hypothetical protein|nr:MAG: hypothetical protein BWX64_00730 [Acidobacteria bacterium ADurb.Bin051]HQN97769.1 hypothetical protein [Thermoanaerobaculales bacterium]
MRVTIAEGATTSSSIDLSQSTFTALLIPDGFTGATITFLAAVDGETWKAVVDDTGAAVSITATDDRWVALSGAVAAKLAPFRFLKLVSASEEEAARTIRFAVRPR